MAICAWYVPLISLIFLKRSLVFPILLFSSICLHWSLNKPFLSLLVHLWNTPFRWVYLSFYPWPFTSHLYSAICMASSGNHFAFWHFFFLGMVLITTPAQCYEPLSIFLQALFLLDLIPWIYLSLLLYNCKVFCFWSYLNGLVIFPTFFYVNLNLQWGVQDLCNSQLLVLFWLTDLLHLLFQRM